MINFNIFNIVVSQGVGSPEKGATWRNGQSVKQSEHNNIYQLSSPSYMGMAGGTPNNHNITSKIIGPRSACVAQSVKCPTLAQVMISQFVGLSPTSGSVLTVQSLEPASNSVSPFLSAPPPLTLCLFVPLSKKKKVKKVLGEK